MEQGWIKLHRKLLENPLIKKPTWGWLWVVLLLKANHEPNKMIWNNNIIIVNAGQFITGRKELSIASGIPESTIEDILKFLENQHQIQQQKTTKYRLITILNWKEYQKPDTKSNNKATTKQQQADTNKNDKNVKNENNIGEAKPSQDINLLIEMFSKINPACKRMYGNTTQRRACQDLIDTYGFDRVKLVIEETLPRTNKMTAEFFPNISTPLQLFDKWQKLEDAIVSYRSKNNIKNKVAF